MPSSVGPFEIKQCHGTSGTVPRNGGQTYIVVHYTAGGDGSPGGAEATCTFFRNGASGNGTGAEYCVDSGTICEYADPSTSYCYHCGDGNGAYGITNSNSIGIEVVAPPYQPEPYTAGEIERLTWLVQKLMKQFNIPADHVVRHYDASRKQCPWYYCPGGNGGDEAWKQLHKILTESSALFSGSTTSSSQSVSGGSIVISDPAIAYAAGIEGQILFDQEEVYPFIISIDENTRDDIDFDKLKTFDVVGVDINLGSYFNESHKVNEHFRSSKLDSQYNAVKEAGLAISISTDIRGRNEEEIKAELYEIRLAALRYRPDIGMWLKPHLEAKVKSKKLLNLSVSKKIKAEYEYEYEEKDRTKNDKLIQLYYDKLIKLGFYDQVGFYCKKDELKKFHWESICENWYWWMDRHLQTVDKIHSMPEPRFFFFNDPKDEDGLIDPDFSGWEALKAAGGGFSSSSTGSGGYTDYQKAVADAAESGEGCTTTLNYCAGFVSDAFKQAKRVKDDIIVPYGDANVYWERWSSSGGTDKNPPVGSVVFGGGWPLDDAGTYNPYGHVGVVLTDGRVADNVGHHRISASVDAWASGQNNAWKGQVGYIGWVWANGQDLSKMGTMIGGSIGSAVAGTLSGTVNIPNGLGTYCTYEKGDINWAAGTYQKQLFAKNPEYDSNGFYFYNGRYIIAMTETFGYAGTMVDIYFHNDKVLKCIIGDTKSSGDAGVTQYGHDGGRNMVEFIIKSNVTPSGASNSWYPAPPGCQEWLSDWWNNQGYNVGVSKVNIMGSVL